MDKSFLATEPIGKLLLKLAIPTITAQLVNMLYNIVDRIYIGHMANGTDALTGLGVCMPIIIAVSAFSMLVGAGGAPKASIAMGKGDDESAESILGNCTSMLILIAVFLTGVIAFFGYDLLLLFGASENTISYAHDYLIIYACGTLFVQFSIGLNAFITAQGFTKISMLTVTIGAVTNIILDPIFIFALNMGVKGAALATVIAQFISAVWAVLFLLGKKTHLHIKLKNMRVRHYIILPCLALGLSPFVMQITESLLSICFNSSLLKYGGDIAVGSMTILISIRQLCTLPIHGLTQGAQPITSFNLGAGNIDRVRESFSLLLKCCVIYTFIMCVAAMLFPKIFISIFSSDVELIEYSSHALRIYLAGMPLFGIQIACQQTFIALGNAKSSLFLACLRKLILLIPLIYILPEIISNKTDAVFMAEPIADFLAVCCTAALFYFEFKKIIGKQKA